MTDSTQRNTTTLTPPSDDQNCYTETPQGVNGEIKAVGKVFSFSVWFWLEYFG